MKIATFLTACALLVIAAVPAFAADDGATGVAATPAPQEQTSSPAPQEQTSSQSPATEPAAPAPTTDSTEPADTQEPTTDQSGPADPADPAEPTDPSTDEGGATGGSGATGSTGEPTSPTTDSTDGQISTPATTNNGDTSTGSGNQNSPKSDGTRTDTGSGSDKGPSDKNDSATAGEQVSGSGGGAVINRLTTDSSKSSSGIGASAGRTAGRATDQIERNAESGVAASLVVTRVINEIPEWVFWALGGLLLATFAGLALFIRERRRRRSAEEDANVDALTGIANRKAFDRRLDLEWRRAARYGRSLGLMVMDLDGFKQVNDIKGHAAGDRVLHDVAQALDGRMRDTDLVARIGGDEFAVICPETGINELMTIRRQLSDHVASQQAEKVGLSIGVAEWVPSDADATDILARADESMYRVKRGEQLAVSA
ncbi:MAG: diguanylate cyclase [Solirubrobacterales bacterium]